MSSAAIDASALIAFLRSEPGHEITAQYLRRSCLSAVNLAEVLEKSPPNVTAPRVLAMLKNWQVEIVAFDTEQAIVAASLRREIGKSNLSFADRACLSLARMRNVPAVTSDREWSDLSLEMEVIAIRGGAKAHV